VGADAVAFGNGTLAAELDVECRLLLLEMRVER